MNPKASFGKRFESKLRSIISLHRNDLNTEQFVANIPRNFKRDYPMRAVIQRVDRACVIINHQEFSSIKDGIVVFLGIEKEDTKDWR